MFEQKIVSLHESTTVCDTESGFTAIICEVRFEGTLLMRFELFLKKCI